MKSYLDLVPAMAKEHRKQNRMTMAAVLFVLVLIAGILMIAGSLNSSVAGRTHKAIQAMELKASEVQKQRVIHFHTPKVTFWISHKFKAVRYKLWLTASRS